MTPAHGQQLGIHKRLDTQTYAVYPDAPETAETGSIQGAGIHLQGDFFRNNMQMRLKLSQNPTDILETEKGRGPTTEIDGIEVGLSTGPFHERCIKFDFSQNRTHVAFFRVRIEYSGSKSAIRATRFTEGHVHVYPAGKLELRKAYRAEWRM
jgi:hypothetical protein